MAERHYYIRFGGIPRDEKSVAWTSENDFKHKKEKHIVLASTIARDKAKEIQMSLFDL